MGEKGLKGLELLWQTFLSVVKILLQSKWNTPLALFFQQSGRVADTCQRSFAEPHDRGSRGFRQREDPTGSELLRHLTHVRAPAPRNLPDRRPAVLDSSREACTTV